MTDIPEIVEFLSSRLKDVEFVEGYTGMQRFRQESDGIVCAVYSEKLENNPFGFESEKMIFEFSAGVGKLSKVSALFEQTVCELEYTLPESIVIDSVGKEEPYTSGNMHYIPCYMVLFSLRERPEKYTAGSGDTIFDISEICGIEPEEILRFNPELEACEVFEGGEVIRIRG